MTGFSQKTSGDGFSGAVAVVETEPIAKEARGTQPRDKSERWIPFNPAGKSFGPTIGLAWALGALGVAACIAPWLPKGRLWFAVPAVAAAVLALYDAIVLCAARNEFAPVLLSSEKTLRGREGQSIEITLALAGRVDRGLRKELGVAIMAATKESAAAMRVTADIQRLKLERPGLVEAKATEHSHPTTHLWPWKPEITLLRRGLWPGPRVGVEQRSRLGVWRWRRWFDSPVPIRIDADLRPGRKEILRSQVYRAFVASRESPWTGHGRDFERLREYQPGDNYAEIAWKSTARRGVPVTRLFQWEQKQEIYFVVDQSRASAVNCDPAPESGGEATQARTRRLLDLSVETALVGATVALEVGDEFGLVTYAEEPKSWLRAGSGQFHFHQFRDRLLNIEPLPTTADYEALFSAIRLRLRRRAYLVLLTDLTERAVADSMCRGITLVRSSHVVLVTSILPSHVRSAFAANEEPRSDQDVYAALAGEKEHQRLGALARQLEELDVQLRFVAPQTFLRTAVEGYLEGKRKQRL